MTEEVKQMPLHMQYLDAMNQCAALLEKLCGGNINLTSMVCYNLWMNFSRIESFMYTQALQQNAVQIATNYHMATQEVERMRQEGKKPS